MKKWNYYHILHIWNESETFSYSNKIRMDVFIKKSCKALADIFLNNFIV